LHKKSYDDIETAALYFMLQCLGQNVLIFLYSIKCHPEKGEATKITEIVSVVANRYSVSKKITIHNFMIETDE
jgi:hypothetical protein